MLPVMPTRSLRSHEPFHWRWEELVAFSNSVAHAHIDHSHDAEDAAQEALLRAWRFRLHCHEVSDPRAWVATITRREAYRIRDRQRGRGELLVEDVPESGAEWPALVTVDERLALAEALQALKEGDRAVLLLRYADDETQPSIAQALGMPEGTVKIRLHRARARLRRELQW